MSDAERKPRARLCKEARLFRKFHSSPYSFFVLITANATFTHSGILRLRRRSACGWLSGYRPRSYFRAKLSIGIVEPLILKPVPHYTLYVTAGLLKRHRLCPLIYFGR